MEAKYDRRQMVRLICEGLNSYQIAARIGTTPSTVRKATRQLKQQQAGTYKPRGRSFYAVPLIDLVPKRTKLDDAKSATIKANRLPLIKEAMEKRLRGLVHVGDDLLPVVDLPAVRCGSDGMCADFGRGRVRMTILKRSATDSRMLRLTTLNVPHLLSSEVTNDPAIHLVFHTRASAIAMRDKLDQLAKGFDQ